ncbi:hypothetical protein [Pararhizobium qamdonense]|uniref:hypothetical protein n=1 Tax=Pararhizobium qamdonense TaxID=3031126 RepID=UPI0023E28E18|nr:hypothetical protein [Pararhizobium qamdonense]
MKARIATGLLFLTLVPAAQAAEIEYTDDTPARAIAIVPEDGFSPISVTTTVFTMAQCREVLKTNAEDLKKEGAIAIMCLPADMRAEGSIEDLPYVNLTK